MSVAERRNNCANAKVSIAWRIKRRSGRLVERYLQHLCCILQSVGVFIRRAARRNNVCAAAQGALIDLTPNVAVFYTRQ